MCATMPACGVSWRPPTCSESRCPRTWAAAVRALWSWHCYWRRWVGASRRCRSTPPCFSAPTPSPATAMRHSGSATFPASSTAHRYSQRDWRSRAAPTRPRPATTGRRDGDGWRLDGIKELVPAAQLARTILIPASLDDGDVGVFLVDADSDGVGIRPVVDDEWRTARRRHPRWCGRSRSASRRRSRNPRIALCPCTCRTVRDPTRRDRARAAHGRVLHHRT